MKKKAKKGSAKSRRKASAPKDLSAKKAGSVKGGAASILPGAAMKWAQS